MYLIVGEPVTLIDSGVATDRAFAALEAGLREHGMDVGDIGRVILTHKHIDHIGAAWRIQRRSGAEIWMHESECHSVSDVDPEGIRFERLVRERLSSWHVPDSVQPGKETSKAIPKWKLQPAEARGLVDGQRLRLGAEDLEVVHTPGHTMGSICLRFGPHLFSGDHVLQDFSPNIGAGDMRHRGILAHYLDSLRRVERMPGTLQVMPGHGEPFTTLSRRCRELREHHEVRLRKILEILSAGPRTVYEVARELFGELRSFHVVLGCAEANAHLELLVDRGRVAREDGLHGIK